MNILVFHIAGRGGADAFEPAPHDLLGVFGGVEQDATWTGDGEAAQARRAPGDCNRQIQGEEGLPPMATLSIFMIIDRIWATQDRRTGRICVVAALCNSLVVPITRSTKANWAWISWAIQIWRTLRMLPVSCWQGFLQTGRIVFPRRWPPNDLATARRLVHGGSNGFDRFVDTYTRGDQII